MKKKLELKLPPILSGNSHLIVDDILLRDLTGMHTGVQATVLYFNEISMAHTDDEIPGEKN